ncbi:MAG: hypothetical protein ACOVO2_24825 [Emticicia sp.]|uniref:hypothetical protein n=1 Tax=Emticicia sp. TaxID=1930953 RepID=UPI003BA40BE9
MENKLLQEFTNQELVEELKKRKKERIIIAIIMGFLIGCSVWSATHKGGFWTFAILFLVLFIGNKYSGKVEKVVKEIDSRKVL